MSLLIEELNSIIREINGINEEIQISRNRISEIKSGNDDDIKEKIAALEELISKIDSNIDKIKAFEEIAKNNLTSINIASIEAPPGYRVNMNRLRNWAMMIDPTTPDDPFAQRLYVVSKCDEFFLAKKKAEAIESIRELKEDTTAALFREKKMLEARIFECQEKLVAFASTEIVSEFASNLITENLRYWRKIAPDTFKNSPYYQDTIAFGAFHVPFSFEADVSDILKSKMGEFYDERNGRVLIPAELPLDKEFVLSINCAPIRSRELDKAIQNFIINLIESAPAGARKIHLIDAVRYNTSSLGSLKPMEDSFILSSIPRNAEQLTTKLEEIVSSLADIDEVLGMYDSVAEYNTMVEEDKRIPLTTLIVYGWPTSFESRNKELLSKILTNYERYGISLIIVSYARNEDKEKDGDKINLPEYAEYSAIHINVHKKNTSIQYPDKEAQRFVLYSFNDVLSTEYCEAVKVYKPESNTIGNEYTDRYPVLEMPTYTRDYKKIEMYFGIDGKDEAHKLSFENENFAAYLVGASRSGKSTLLHTLIADMIRNYHPDNLELWLADFKQLEFKRYIKHRPPHIKYILLDESRELVFDLVDRLTAIMMERQKIFAQFGKQRIDQFTKDDVEKYGKPLPVIFVILDEFSIMSQAIAEDANYKLRLQNILAKGAALGIKFIFSSQTFTTGVGGLTSTARIQIQQRIAMRGPREEISETLELSAALKTEQINNWMDALPPHYALVKFRTGPDTMPQVKRFLVMYFKDYGIRDDMIDIINSTMIPGKTLNMSSSLSYVDKSPVTVDGNSFDMYNDKVFAEYIAENSSKEAQDEANLKLAFGTPRLMERIKIASISDETRENIILFARLSEQACAASIIMSVIKESILQKHKVHIWAYGKNKLYTQYRQLFENSAIEIVEGIDAVCDAIYKMKNDIDSKINGNDIFILLGMDRICLDFDYIDGNNGNNGNSQSDLFEQSSGNVSSLLEEGAKNGAFVTSENEALRTQFLLQFQLRKMDYIEEQTALGKTQEQIDEGIAEIRESLINEIGYNPVTESDIPVQSTASAEKSKSSDESVDDKNSNEHKSGAYNALNDFVYLVKQGSRLGYHFFLNLNSFADLKQTGLKMEFFRHRMSFQIPSDDSREVFNSKIADSLPEHICQYYDLLESYSFRPYIHESIGWDGWYIDKGKLVDPYEIFEKEN